MSVCENWLFCVRRWTCMQWLLCPSGRTPTASAWCCWSSGGSWPARRTWNFLSRQRARSTPTETVAVFASAFIPSSSAWLSPLLCFRYHPVHFHTKPCDTPLPTIRHSWRPWQHQTYIYIHTHLHEHTHSMTVIPVFSSVALCGLSPEMVIWNLYIRFFLLFVQKCWLYININNLTECFSLCFAFL